jgi:hypothetical protein
MARKWTKTAEGNYRSGNLELRRGFNSFENATAWTLVFAATGERVLRHDRFTLRAAKQDAAEVRS